MSARPLRPALLEPAAVARTDPGKMREIIASMPEQLLDGLRRGMGTHASLQDARRVFLVGMGGSAIAGDIFRAWIASRSKVPIQVVRDYHLPSYAEPGDVLVAISYSGDTEETLAATADGIKLGCHLIAVTSGGTLAELARSSGAEVIVIPRGLPPRGAFGHLFGILPGIGEDWIYGDLKGELERAVVHLKDLRKRFRPEAAAPGNHAKALARRLKGKTPIVYAAPPLTPVAKRWQTQLNENAKVLAFSSEFPEADHNELVGWCSDGTSKRFAPVLLRDSDETPEMHRRLDATAALLARGTPVEQVRDSDDELLGRMLGLLYLGDFVSLYLAVLRRVDPLPVAPIQELKAQLARRRGKS